MTSGDGDRPPGLLTGCLLALVELAVVAVVFVSVGWVLLRVLQEIP